MWLEQNKTFGVAVLQTNKFITVITDINVVVTIRKMFSATKQPEMDRNTMDKRIMMKKLKAFLKDTQRRKKDTATCNPQKKKQGWNKGATEVISIAQLVGVVIFLMTSKILQIRSFG